MIRNTSGQDRVITHSRFPIKKKRIIWAVASLCLIGFLYQQFQGWLHTIPSVKLSEVQTAVVERGTLSRDIRTQGKIVAANAPTLYSPSKGYVRFIKKAGSQVLQGDIIAEISSPELLNTLKQEQARLQDLESQQGRTGLEIRKKSLAEKQALNLAKVNLIAAKREKERAEISYASKLISDLDFKKYEDELTKAELEFQHAKETAELNKDSLQFELRSSKLAVQRQALIVEELARKKEQLKIKAPFNGVVGNWFVEQQSQVQANQSLLSIVDLSVYEAELQVPENYADELGIGQHVEIRINGNTRLGEIISISPEVDEQKISARAKFIDDITLKLRQNQRINARILLEQKENVLIVKRGPFINAGGRFTYFIHDGFAIKQNIQIGDTSVSHVEITSGASVGQTLVISSLDNFEQAEKIALN